MKIVWMSLVVVSMSFGVAFGQKQSRLAKTKTVCGPARKLIDQTKPTAFLTFVRKERIETQTRRGSHADYLFFKLTNNSCWPIWLPDVRHGR